MGSEKLNWWFPSTISASAAKADSMFQYPRHQVGAISRQANYSRQADKLSDLHCPMWTSIRQDRGKTIGRIPSCPFRRQNVTLWRRDQSHCFRAADASPLQNGSAPWVSRLSGHWQISTSAICPTSKKDYSDAFPPLLTTMLDQPKPCT